MAEKSFRDLLSERMKSQTETVSPRMSPFAPFSQPWIDLQVIVSRPSIQDLYPRKATPAKPKAERAVPRPDLLLKILQVEEIAAVKALGLGAKERLLESECKQAYRRLIRRLHPDRFPTDLGPMEREKRTREFQAVHEAYLILANAVRLRGKPV